MTPKKPFSPARRHCLRLLGASALAAVAMPGTAAPHARQPVVVLTSYNDEVFSRFEAAFEKAYPQYKLQLVWRMPNDARPYLEQEGQGGIDLYWSASPRSFAALAKQGAWQVLGIDRQGLPEQIGKTRLADTQGYYTATEMAGYVFVTHRAALGRLGVNTPGDWPDLCQPQFAGQILLPNPARVGFAPVMVDIVLQAFGWERGWAIWSAIAGNAGAISERGSTFVTDEVGSGRLAVGLSIDFFAASALANGSPIKLVYPAHGGINPAHIAIARNAANPVGARAFVEFVLSEDGQKLITHADIRKLPVRPAVYEKLPPDYFNPFLAAQKGAFDFDGERTRARLPVISAVFEQDLIRQQGELAALWQRIHRAEASGKNVAAARKTLESPLLPEEEASSEALGARFADRLEGTNPARSAQEEAWAEASVRRRGKVDQLLLSTGA